MPDGKGTAADVYITKLVFLEENDYLVITPFSRVLTFLTTQSVLAYYQKPPYYGCPYFGTSPHGQIKWEPKDILSWDGPYCPFTDELVSI